MNDSTGRPSGDPTVRRVVFFDGVCGLCDRSVRFLIARDHERILRYAPLQGETAAAEPALSALRRGGGPELESVLYVRGAGDAAEVFARSDAALAILHDLGGIWRVLSWARWIPRPIRDWVYNFVARNRYRWFGRFDSCRLPSPDEAELFLD